MNALKQKPAKSCVTQLSELPSLDWDLTRIESYAADLSRKIDEVERPLAQEHWRLGSSLTMLKQKGKFRRGEFSALLKRLGIDKTRASKARAIFRTFATAEKLDGLTVEAAYQRRERKMKKQDDGKPVRKSTRKLPNEFEASSGPAVWLPLPGFLADAARHAERCLAEAKKAPPANARAMAEEIAATINKLQRLQEALAVAKVTDGAAVSR